MNTIRIGFGYDVHRLVSSRNLILGGVKIPHPYGLLGHSDADVITHALCDAILGAAALGDLGRHFPDLDPRYAGISSIKLLKEVIQKIVSSGWRLGNADITLVAQSPKIAPFVAEMKKNISEACKVSVDQINIKATTTEGLGFTGNGEGMAAYAVVTIIDS
ncbi:MAG: 2-C-methyl-D-erythritol 2,4-cyclodiphosphate synthase [Deltaproteobacteria bacterium]|nr:2-C-methyl-D-erythritol 2,4-cyclodiphosphate synthase [Deltaproteobacteria bacterium]MBW1966094.1 2-C-methyl-D-erythritol 2,4-cyclodiphosphate synthase [Deltaproteobacteria bacterium]MBW2097643.1 2-C-methyl-D-erythritol 2,4-cyclodiphosphate synthase [Deltaproteobacteria bacterium]PXF54582.1 MAG: 2-C-methyl-D-erythritol 2,4-cyclodiphosphate synthase [Deltaproteobacteria bacterium]RKX59634.1 MAG: 2-C-methyl-D-erythritol 2,4-cyclodiphosphate synthase [Thermodesulfobacteriota bacterium]